MKPLNFALWTSGAHGWTFRAGRGHGQTVLQTYKSGMGRSWQGSRRPKEMEPRETARMYENSLKRSCGGMHGVTGRRRGDSWGEEMKADATLELQPFRGKECCGRRCAQSGEWWGVPSRRSTPVLKRPWWRVWGAALDSRVRGDRSERCREKHLRQCGQGTLWRRQRASGKEEPREDAHPAKAGEEELGTPGRGCAGRKSVSVYGPRPTQPVNGWKGHPSEQIPPIILLFEASLQGQINRTTQILSSKSRHILGVKWSTPNNYKGRLWVSQAFSGQT